ncbi:hypothetical protein NMY22_g3274 [Coprinellus aureogranulatus]|nr:hypothetical protein NMY22_g3274 [Coprinellus aureogranulatus]
MVFSLSDFAMLSLSAFSADLEENPKNSSLVPVQAHTTCRPAEAAALGGPTPSASSCCGHALSVGKRRYTHQSDRIHMVRPCLCRKAPGDRPLTRPARLRSSMPRLRPTHRLGLFLQYLCFPWFPSTQGSKRTYGRSLCQRRSACSITASTDSAAEA